MIMSNKHLEMIDLILSREKIKYTTEHGGKHPFVKFQYYGEEMKMPYPGTPGDFRGHLNTKTELQQMLRHVREKSIPKDEPPSNGKTETGDEISRKLALIEKLLRAMADKFDDVVTMQELMSDAIANLVKSQHQPKTTPRLTMLDVLKARGTPQKGRKDALNRLQAMIRRHQIASGCEAMKPVRNAVGTLTYDAAELTAFVDMHWLDIVKE